MKKIIVILSMILIAVVAVGCEKQTERPDATEEVVLEEHVLEETVLEETYLVEETLYKIDGIKLNEYFIRMNYGDDVFDFIKYYTEEYKHLEGVNCHIGSFYTWVESDNEHYREIMYPDCILACHESDPDRPAFVLYESTY